jgi:small subunit ribosomal protein S5
MRKNNRPQNVETRLLQLRRVAKVTSGGRRLGFSAIVVAGDKKGKVGVALGKGPDPRSAIQKAERLAGKNLVKIDLIGDTIPHSVEKKYKAARIIMRPARPGTGVIAGSAPRALLELAGVENVYAKQLGSNNMIANTYCAFEALKSLRSKRVLEKMDKMKERIEYKKQMDQERREKAKRVRKKQGSKRGGKDKGSRNRKKSRGGSRKGSSKPKKESKSNNKSKDKKE